jgi:uncharacterized protein (DUF2164 family)
MIPFKLPKESKDQAVQAVKAYFESERSEQIGDLASEQMVDLVLQEIGPFIYNKALSDARHTLNQKMALLEDELYALEISAKRDKRK